MTREQADTINQLRRWRYSVRVVRTIAEGVVLVRIKCKLHRGNMPLRVYPDGRYVAPCYDSHGNRAKARETWPS